MKSQLAIVRHGQSEYNLENKFTGFADVDLTAQGREEALMCGRKLQKMHFDDAFTSVLKRAIETLDIILDTIGQKNIPVFKDAALNERNYGDLQGLNKAETAEKYGADKVALWRRSFDVAPPGGESLKQTQERVLPYYYAHIEPLLQQGKNVLIVAHGNSLRALMMHLENISPAAIVHIELLTGVPRVYDFDDNGKISYVEHLAQ
ncbi:MAG: 2,3-diphosphoglycerate-dependent phosphoglycerate mutase [Mucilaginibacter sp.]|uniref:2,3-bisphosphoglycerate-dependent phosphoglycerate mutase n=1 Tax=Mucilaginibacter sp. TaxID=1882438 RepID=UPI0034E531B8